jgi:phosphatidylglycerol:prolipoprotein diacylglycerol transferase
MAFFFWDPPREAFIIPYFEIAIYWYSLFFALGFFAAYIVVRSFVKRQIGQKATRYTDTLGWYIFFGMLIGARLGHVFFYDWDYFSTHLLEIPLTRYGGLASHGATAGILTSIFLFVWRHKEIRCKKLMDYIAIVAALTGGFVRIGNFINQEIQGTATELPWAVIFGHPADGITVPCHPVQLYEAIFCFILFASLFWIMRKYEDKIAAGRVAGVFLVALFIFRLGIECIKIPQEMGPVGILNVGQQLSLPFIGLGLYLLFCKK